MPDPIIHSSSWTGPIETPDPPSIDLGPESLGLGEPAAPLSPAVRQWAVLVAAVFFSPLLLLGAFYFVHAATHDELWSDRREWLIYWGIAVFAVFAREMYVGKPANPGARSAFLALVLMSTVTFAVWYSHLVVAAHADAIATPPERAFELHRSCGRNCGYYFHQRADGSTVEGVRGENSLPYGNACTIVQRMDGDYGLTWIRVVDRSPSPEHEIAWPIRREDCFSDKPLSSLRP
jgi:hypothetical protein